MTQGDTMHARPAARVVGAAIALGLLLVMALMAPSASAAHTAYATHWAPMRLVQNGAQEGVVTIVPSAVEPGDTVEIDTDVCGLDSTATATSSVFVDPVNLEPIEEDFRLVGVGEIDPQAPAGLHTVTVECAGGAQAQGEVRVVPPGGPETGGGGLAQSGGMDDSLARRGDLAASNRTADAGLPTGQGVALVALLGAGALIGAVVAVRARRRPGPS